MLTHSRPKRKTCLLIARGLVALFILLSTGPRSSGYAAKVAGSQPAGLTVPASPAQTRPRTVNIPYIPGDVIWSESAIFWFGVNDPGSDDQSPNYSPLPSRNYADVRIAYTPDALRVLVTVVDYHLWYNDNPHPGDDLTIYDAVGLYLDTHNDRAATPQTDDYLFLVASRHYPEYDSPDFRRQARGTGSAWDSQWGGDWIDYGGMQWECNPGPNSNTCGIDYGWAGGFDIPWATLGLAGPPSEGTLWGMGVLLYDRDGEPPAGAIAPESWPETFNANTPSTWGLLHYGYADYQPPAGVPRGTTMIRAASDADNTVEDSWNGGGGWCYGGHMGHREENHGASTDLFVGVETAPTHFPCYSKSYLRFSLDAIPRGKVILSATLTLHHWGDAGNPGDDTKPTWASLFTITDPWQEMVIHWNNAPMAQENVSASWIPLMVGDPDWPKTPVDWDATQAVAEAYSEGLPANMAIYASDTAMNSSKYLISSETGDWNIEGRPKLTVTWGDPLATLSKQVLPVRATHGVTVTYTLEWLGTGQAMTLTDVLPAGLSNPVSLEASSGTASYDAGTRQISWTGTPALDQAVNLTYVVEVQVSGPLFLTNTAVLETPSGNSSASATLFVDCLSVFLPTALK